MRQQPANQKPASVCVGGSAGWFPVRPADLRLVHSRASQRRRRKPEERKEKNKRRRVGRLVSVALCVTGNYITHNPSLHSLSDFLQQGQRASGHFDKPSNQIRAGKVDPVPETH